ncbi:hypothetical protein CLUG_05485 [Clavispora lusitaniae ATCC 42720]|uniref:Steryl acetyl hydrolase n=1 Tax=Clavispora lusitaniae (strain ATCC 42720) TaxID=306902 RepID=C4YBA7_CLAL4|nr:uncharacterized protein CLUG_05485 [Clavispora lusitaniae ATCC 42720]EEQ41357.1 hypothetical protein CLUG_05485 [Clavispora lusitaniae ATCC 42720]
MSAMSPCIKSTACACSQIYKCRFSCRLSCRPCCLMFQNKFLHSLFIVLSIPWDILVVTLRYYIFGGLNYRKYESSLLNCIKMRVLKASLAIDMEYSYLLAPYSNGFLIRWMLPMFCSTLVKDLPGLGYQYDENSLWLVKQSQSTKTDPVIIYAHGGGYFIQTIITQLKSILAVFHLLEPEIKSKTSILFLDYKLVGGGHPFPTQLEQLHATYCRLLDDGYSNISLMGDSAGGHLSVSYTQYLKSLNRPVEYPKNLILISPWLNVAPQPNELVKGRSWIDNKDYDLIHYSRYAHIENLATIFGDVDPFSLVHGIMAKVPKQRSDWDDIPNYSNKDYHTFLIFGEHESFRDDILEWAKYAFDLPWYEAVTYGNSHKLFSRQHYEFKRRNKDGNASLTAYVEPLGVHDSMLFFEDGVADQIADNIRSGRPNSADDVDPVRYFGVVRLANFLNETL